MEEYHYKKVKKVLAYYPYPKIKELRMAEVINIVSEKTKGDAIVVSDVGQHQMMSACFYKFKHANHFITSG